MNAEEFGGLREVAVCLFDGLQDELLLHVIHCFVIIRQVLRRRTGGQQRFRKIIRHDHVCVAKNDRAFDGIFQFANIAGPVICHQTVPRFRRDTTDKSLTLLAGLRDEIVCE